MNAQDRKVFLVVLGLIILIIVFAFVVPLMMSGYL